MNEKHSFLTIAAMSAAICVSAQGAEPVTVVVDAGVTRPVSPYIYGANQADFRAQKYLTLTRWGGNRTTAYNWENNASNAGSDWQHQNDGFLSKSDVPAAPVLGLISSAQAAGAAVIVTVPTIGYVAADKGNDGDVGQREDYISKRFVRSYARSPGRADDRGKPDMGDGKVYQDQFVAYLERSFGAARGQSNKTLFYALDNEPDLWSETHARIHPAKLTYEELVKNNIEYASAIKAAAPKAQVLGFASYGFAGWTSLQGAADANHRHFLDFYLAEMAEAEKVAGKRLIDAIDLHWYPEARGGGVRITEDSAEPAVAEARMQAPRSLWDESYVEDSWITKDIARGPMRLIGDVRDRIAKHYPGTKLVLGEYYFGGGDHISGGIAEADALGIFGREGVFAAALWHVGRSKDTFIHAAFRMYLDYDGKGSTVGETSLAAATSDRERTSVYALKNANGRVALVAINKASEAVRVDVELRGVKGTRGAIYRLTADKAAPVAAGSVAATGGHLKVELPELSVTTIVLEP